MQILWNLRDTIVGKKARKVLFWRDYDPRIDAIRLMYETMVVVDPDLESGYMSDSDLVAFSGSVRYIEEVESKLGDDSERIMEELVLAGMAEKNKMSNVATYGLNSNGVQYAHNLKIERQTNLINVLLVGLTVILVVLTCLLII